MGSEEERWGCRKCSISKMHKFSGAGTKRGGNAGVCGQGGSPSLFKILIFCLSWSFYIIIIKYCIIIFILIPEFLWRPLDAACRVPGSPHSGLGRFPKVELLMVIWENCIIKP